MSQHYTDPKREQEPTSLPDIETWQEDAIECRGCGETVPSVTNCPSCGQSFEDDDSYRMEMRNAWWYWSCSPGCLPDGEAMGPFETEAEALEDAREGME